MEIEEFYKELTEKVGVLDANMKKLAILLQQGKEVFVEGMESLSSKYDGTLLVEDFDEDDWRYYFVGTRYRDVFLGKDEDGYNLIDYEPVEDIVENSDSYKTQIDAIAGALSLMDYYGKITEVKEI